MTGQWEKEGGLRVLETGQIRTQRKKERRWIKKRKPELVLFQSSECGKDKLHF